MAYGVVQFAHFNGAGGGDQTLATPRSGSRILLLSYSVSARGTGVAGIVVFKSGATQLFSVNYPAASGTAGASVGLAGTRDAPLDETALNQALVVTTPATDCSVRVAYIDTDV